MVRLITVAASITAAVCVSIYLAAVIVLLHGGTGIYYDDTFFHANFNPAPAGPAYVDDSGQLRAGVSLWAWRDFLRRSATLQHTIARFQGTKPTVLYIHMTKPADHKLFRINKIKIMRI